MCIRDRIKTVKGFGMGKSGEGKNNVHQTKKLTDEDIKIFRDRFNIPIPDSQLAEIPFYKPADDTPEMRYLHERRKALGGYLPQRRPKADEALKVPDLSAFQAVLDPTAEGREISTTQAYVRFLTALLRDKEVGPRTGPSRRCRLQLMTKTRLSSFSRPATPIAPSDSTSSVSPSPRKAHTLRPSVCARPRSCRYFICLLYTSPSPRDRTRSRMPSSA